MSRLAAALQAILPQHLISRLVGRIARTRIRPVKSLLIRIVVWLYRIDLSESDETDPDAYPSFTALFTRGLRADARRIEHDPAAVIAPADGVVSQCGSIEAGTLLQAKGKRFTTTQLLGDEHAAAPFESGSFVTVYLAPHNYHRVHVPLDARLTRMTHIPGRLFSVSPATTRAVDALFARNERVVFHFDSETGPVVLVMVGALIVGSIETVHAGLVAPGGRRPRDWRYTPPLVFRRGQELARFNLGSTVILLFSADGPRLDDALCAEAPVRFGETIAR